MTANDYLIIVIGLFLILTGGLYLNHIRKEGRKDKREKYVSLVLLLAGIAVAAIPFMNFSSDVAEEDGVKGGSLLGSDVYKQAIPASTKDYEAASALYVKAVSFYNVALSGYDSADVAMDLLNRSIQLYETAEALTARGQLKVQLGKFKSALEDYFRAVELKPDFGNAYYNRAAIYYIQGQLDYACADWQMANDLGVPNTEEVLKLYCNN